jgi:hypothetical protein
MCEPLHTRVKIDACESGGMGYGVPAKTMSSEDVLGDAPALSVDFLNVEQRAKDRW